MACHTNLDFDLDLDLDLNNHQNDDLDQEDEDEPRPSEPSVRTTKDSSSCLLSRMALNDNKAGMEGLDKDKINQIIYNSSKGSKFFENERKKEEQLNERIKEQQMLAKSISEEKLQEGHYQADLLLAKLLQQRDLTHCIVHVDMDAYYAAVEMRDNPSLKSKPMAVGDMGMLSTSNYLARKYGVRAAMPGFIGLKLCPDLVMVKPNFENYRAVSQEIRQVLAVYDPNFCPMSLDEAYLDFGPHLQYRVVSPPSSRTFILRLPKEEDLPYSDGCSDSDSKCTCDLNCVLLPALLDLEEFSSSSSSDQELQSVVNDIDSIHASGRILKICGECKKTFPKYCLKIYGVTIEDAVLEMRNRIEQRTFLTASAGIAPNMMLAKVCSDKNKPNGQFMIPSDVYAVEGFVRDLPIRKISGVGKVTEKLLNALGVTKCSDIYQHKAMLFHLFSPTSFQHFMRIYLGMGSTVVQRDDERKSMSTESTFSEISDKDELCCKCEEICKSLAQDLKDEHLKGKTVTLKIKCVSFEVKTRSQTLQNATNEASIIFATARQLLLTEVKNSQPAPLRLRLMGVRISKFVAVEKKEVTVKDMFKKLTARSSSCSNQEKSLNNNKHWPSSATDIKGPSVVVDDLDDSVEHGDCFIVSSSDHTQSRRYQDRMVENSAKQSNKGKPRGISSSKNIVKFLTKETLVQDQEGHSYSASNDVVLTEQSYSKMPRNDVCELSVLQEEGRISSPRSMCGSDTSQDNILSLSVNFRDRSNSKTLTCPVCGVTKTHWDLTLVNSHVDVCLSQQTIKEMLNDDKTKLPTRTASTSLPSEMSQQSAITANLKRARSETQTNQQRKEKPKKIQRTVASFFQK